MEETLRIFPITAADNADLAKIIRNALEEHNANKPGTVYFDESTDHLSDIFTTAKSAYFVLHCNGEVAGGAGIFPTNGLSRNTCELVKMYLAPEYRGKGHGKQLIQICITKAKELGYKFMYIETLPELKNAISLYKKFGFKELPGPLGDSGHNGCDIWMLKEI